MVAGCDDAKEMAIRRSDWSASDSEDSEGPVEPRLLYLNHCMYATDSCRVDRSEISGEVSMVLSHNSQYITF